MQRTFIAIICAALWLAAAPQALAAQGTWRMLQTEHYTVLSSLRDTDTRNWAREYDQFIVSTAGMLSISPKQLPPLTVILFAKDKDYTPYKIVTPGGRTANVAGQFVRRPTWSVIGLAERMSDQFTREVIFHEGTHWLMSVDPHRQPPWFSEGIAEIFSTFERRGDKVNWAKPISGHLAELNMRSPMPLASYLVQESAIFERDSHTGRFYAQAWAFMHFMLMSENGTRRPQLTRLLEAWRTQSPEAAVRDVFGEGIGQLDKDFRLYTSQRSFAYIGQEAKPTSQLPELTDAPPAVVEAALGALAMGSGKEDLARQHATQAIVLDPAYPRGHELLAYLAAFDGQDEAMVGHAEAALQRGSRDADMFMMMGDAHAHGPKSDLPDAAVRRVRLYQSAVNLNPRRPGLFEKLVEAMTSVESPTAEDLRFLEAGMRLFPDDDWIKVGAADAAWRLGQHESATKQLDAALRPDGTLDGSQRQWALMVRARWLVEQLQPQLNAAMEKRDVATATNLLEQFLAQPDLPDEMRRYAEDFRSSLRQ